MMDFWILFNDKKFLEIVAKGIILHLVEVMYLPLFGIVERFVLIKLNEEV